MPEAVLYARFSPRPSAEECDSVEKQLERCRAYSIGQGYTVEPLIPHRLTNAGQDIARLFNISLVPLGRVTGEPLAPEMLR